MMQESKTKRQDRREYMACSHDNPINSMLLHAQSPTVDLLAPARMRACVLRDRASSFAKTSAQESGSEGPAFEFAPCPPLIEGVRHPVPVRTAVLYQLQLLLLEEVNDGVQTRRN